MSFTTTLQKALNTSDTEYVNDTEVERYLYPGEDFNDTVRLILADDEEVTFSLQQAVEVSEGCAAITDVEGKEFTIYFEVNRPLAASDMGR